MGKNSRLRGSLVLITIAGCLAMIYAAGTTSPAFVEFMRAIGATDAHFGLLGGIPMIMLALQFVGAAITNVIPRRKPLFMILVISGRFLYIPLALVPAVFPSFRGDTGVYFVFVLIAVSGALTNIAGPMWLSWMADLIPRRILNTYWGRRQRWMHLTWTAAFLGVAAFSSFMSSPVTVVFPVLATIAVVAGIVDILLFNAVHEPANVVVRRMSIFDALMAPLRNLEYRSFLVFSCAWSCSAMLAAAFMQVYALKVLGMAVWQATLTWCVSGIGVALVSSRWGRLADRYGHRPILAICIGTKSAIVLVFLLVTPSTAVWVLPITLFVDSFWNSGILVASNGYMLKIAPEKNRSMFIAAITALAGICGGLGAISGGALLSATNTLSAEFFGRSWGNYHLLFTINIFMRLGCVYLAYRIKEPRAATPEKLLHVLYGVWPMRFILFPIGMYRRLDSHWTSIYHRMKTTVGGRE